MSYDFLLCSSTASPIFRIGCLSGKTETARELSWIQAYSMPFVTIRFIQIQAIKREYVTIFMLIKAVEPANEKRKENRRIENYKHLSSRIFTDCGPKYGKTEIVNISDKIWRNATIGEFP